ncbi:structural constituent of cell wall [Ceratobasidium sp. AG-Ba]|nr:structural constituent of cell wall [Ceratobasidium sp. AG-Ba]
MSDHYAAWPSSAPSTPKAEKDKGDNQLRESVRKMRKRVVSVIRRGSKQGKSRGTSEEPTHSDRATSTDPDDEHKHTEDENKSHNSEHEHEHVDSGDDHSQHSGRSRTSSAGSRRHSLFGSHAGSRPGSRPSSPQPPMTSSQSASGHLTVTAPSSPSTTPRRLSILGFPRSPRKNKADDGAATVGRARTVSTPGSSSALESLVRLSSVGAGLGQAGEHGKLTVPIPKRERTLSHPLAASPIQAASPTAVQDTTFSFGAAMQQANDTAPTKPEPIVSPSADGTPAPLVDSPEAEITAPPLAASPPTQPSIPDVITAPNTDVFTAPTPKTEITPQVVEPSASLELSTTSNVSASTRDASLGHSRESSATREPGTGLSRAASTVGSDLGWSILEPTKEEDEPEDEAVKSQVQIKVEDMSASVPSKVDEATAKVEEPVVKVEEVPIKIEETPVVTVQAAPKVEDAAETDVNELPVPSSLPASGERTPLAVPDDEEEVLMNGAFVLSPEGTHGPPTRQQSQSGDLGPSGIFIDTPQVETHPKWISSVPTPPRSVTPPRPRVAFSPPETPPAQTGSAFYPGSTSTPAGAATQESPDTPSPSRMSGTYSPYAGDQTPPPPVSNMSESFFHPRNVERLNPRHFERSMSTMGVFGDAEPDGSGVQERLGGVAAVRPSIDTMLAPDMSVHEMISPSVRAAANGGVEDNDLRGLAGTELRDWYEGEGRTPKTVRMMLPENEAAGSNGAVPSRPRSALSQSHTPTLQPPIQLQPSSQEIQQPQSERAQVYSSVLSRLMSHMDRRSTLMSRLATRLGNLGGLPVVERHPREWVAQSLPSGKMYYTHRLLASESPAKNQLEHVNSETKVLIIPTPSAPLPVTLVTDLDMADNATHQGVNAFVDKCLQERDTDLPNGWEVWVHAAGASEQLDWEVSSASGSGASEVDGPGEEIDLGYGAPLTLVWSYVSHKRRRVGPQGPETRFVEGEDAEFDLEMERRYWAYVETHPAHGDVNPRAVQEAIELLTWHYTDRLLAEKKKAGEKETVSVKPPFTPEESHEVLEFLKSLSQEHSHANAVLKTRTVARVHVRTAEWRLAKLQAVHDAVNLEVMSPAERIRRRRVAANPFVGVPLRTLAGLLGLGIPYLFVEQPDEKVEDRQRLMVADASTNLMSALMLGASVSFLAIPDLEDIARLAGVAAAACSLGSLAAGILRLRIPSSRSGQSEETREDEPKPSALRTFARSLPLVLSAYAGSALVAGLAAYSWRGQVSPLDDPFTRLYFDDSWRADQAGGRWLGGLVRRDGGSGHGSGGLGSESNRPGWAEASSQGLIRLWGTW